MYLCIWIFVSNKVVEGSGSEGASKYMGEGMIYGVFLGTLAIFHTCACLLMMPPCQQGHAPSAYVIDDVTSWYVVTRNTDDVIP